jgi:Fic family protein
MRRLFIYQQPDWPQFTWQNEELIRLLAEVRNLQGRLIGKMEGLGFDQQERATLETLSLEVVKSTEIEGEILNTDQVRSSVARQLGFEFPGMVNSDRHVDGVVEMMLDATQNFSERLSKKRLLAWHASLFPEGRSGMHKIITGKWRDDSTGPMVVVSGAMGKEKVHYHAPDAGKLEMEMKQFISWFNEDKIMEPVLKAAVAHLWFVTIHPFDDGNGRIARAIADMQLARSDDYNQRFYSMSAQIRKERKEYYDILEKTQKGNTDITQWLKWFLDCLKSALQETEKHLAGILKKTKFWEKYTNTELNNRQKQMINKLFDGFYGDLGTSKWAKITKTSHDTALRDIQDLLNKNILVKKEGGGRSTSYELKD